MDIKYTYSGFIQLTVMLPNCNVLNDKNKKGELALSSSARIKLAASCIKMSSLILNAEHTLAIEWRWGTGHLDDLGAIHRYRYFNEYIAQPMLEAKYCQLV